MARKSADAKAAEHLVATTIARVSDRAALPPAPPKHLTRAAAAAWREIVATVPRDYLRAEHAPMVEALAVAIAEHRRIASVLDNAAATDARDYATLLRLMDAQAGRIASISTRLRLTPQSRYRPETAGRHAAKPGPFGIEALSSLED